MAILKSAIKRINTNNKKRLQNQPVRSDMRTQIKRVEDLVNANDVEGAKEAYKTTTRKIDKAIQKGVIHRNNGNRQKARLAKRIKQINA